MSQEIPVSQRYFPLFDSLVAADPSSWVFKIPPLSTGKYANEYGEFVADYSKHQIAVTKRLIKPYIARETHGTGIYKETVKLLGVMGVKRVLDLGCGSGELLEDLGRAIPAELVGVTIHSGEVIHARSQRNLPKVVPFDMRFIDKLFQPESFDCVIAYASLQFIPMHEREELLGKICVILENGGVFVEVNYKQDEETGMPESACKVFRREFSIEYPAVSGEVGRLRVFRKARHLDGNGIKLADDEIQRFARIYKADHYVLPLPRDPDVYERSISSSFRNEARQSARRGNTFERLYFLSPEDSQQILDIFHSTDVRQDRPVNFAMEVGWERPWSLLGGNGWPLRDYFSLRNSTLFFVVRSSNQAIVAYMEIYRNDETAIVHSTMAHSEYLSQGVNKQLFLSSIRFLIEMTQVKSVCYGVKMSTYQPQMILLRGFRFG